MRTALKNTLKLLLAAAFLLAVGWSVVLFNGTPAAPVKAAQADIAMLEFGPKTQQQRFISGLQELGMEKPRSYDWNGNKVFFSMMHTKDTPQQILQKAHKTFKAQGLNKKSNGLVPPELNAYIGEYVQTGTIQDTKTAQHQAEQALQSWDDFFSGGLIPVVDQPDHILMVGGTGHGENITDALSYMRAQQASGKNMIDMVKSMQVLEATRHEGADTTLVTAVWSDDQLDMKRFMNEGENTNVNPDIPACPGCTRLMTLGGETGNERGYIATSFIGSASKESVVSFYDRALGARGWRRMESSILLDKMRARQDLPMQPPGGLAGYSRDDAFITLDVSHDHQGATFVQLLQSP